MHKSVYSFVFVFLHRKKEKVMNSFLFNILTLVYDREGFWKPKRKTKMSGENVRPYGKV